MSGAGLMPVEEAAMRVVAGLEPVAPEIISVSEALGRVLAEPVLPRRTQPPHDLSAMDGWAVRAADVEILPARLKVIGTAPAGHRFDGEVGRGEAVRIFTGGFLPAGADTVVLQEDTHFEAGVVEVREAGRLGRHVRKAGIDFVEGQEGLPAGRLVSARDVGLLAAMNVPWVAVRRRPRVAILATGDELVRPGDPVGPAQIISSNSLAVAGIVRAHGAEAIDLGIARDEETALVAAARRAEVADLLVTIGGASVGEHDLVQRALGAAGLQVDFWKIAMRPGKPLMFGRMARLPVLGLPGNPVSAMVCALLFMRPMLDGLLGMAPRARPHRTARLGSALGANDRRQDYLRARLEPDADGRAVAFPFPSQDSSLVSVLAAADCLLVRPPHAPPAAVGDEVEIIPLGDGRIGV
jgi:molybdopterin molybdotransferase